MKLPARTLRSAPIRRASRPAAMALLFMPGLLLFSCLPMERRARSYIEALPAEKDPGGIITSADLAGLPPVVRRYLEYSGVVGKPRIASFSFTIEGRIRRGPEAAWMPIEARQYNLLAEPSRVFYIRGLKTPMAGVDSYLGGRGRMHIKVLNLVTVADSRGPEMDRSGLVTFLNDLLVCPLAYFSVPVSWRQLDERRAELSLAHAGNTVRAVLSFDELGRLVNWESADRYGEEKGKPVPDRWSTPMKAWALVAGLHIPVAGEGVHNYSGTPFTYIELTGIRDLAWNRRGLPPGRAGQD